MRKLSAKFFYTTFVINFLILIMNFIILIIYTPNIIFLYEKELANIFLKTINVLINTDILIFLIFIITYLIKNCKKKIKTDTKNIT